MRKPVQSINIPVFCELFSKCRRFRLVPSEDFLDEFASDRSHMRDEDGSWMKPPPSYSPIRSKSSSHNLDLYINVNCNIANSEVLDYCQLSERF